MPGSAPSVRVGSACALPAIRAVTPLSLCDWPGKSASVVYLGGCNLRCPGCHNGSLAWTPEKHPALDNGSVLATLTQRKDWLDGVVVCGGEPTLDPALPALVAALSGLGLPVKVDTNGTRPHVVAQLLAQFPETVFAVDVKGPWDKYPQLTGGALSPEEAQASLTTIFQLASGNPAAFQFRITLVPGLTPDDVARAGAYLPVGAALRQQPFIHPKESAHAPAD